MKELKKKLRRLAATLVVAVAFTSTTPVSASAMPADQPTVAEAQATAETQEAKATQTQQAAAQAISVVKPSKFAQLSEKELTLEVGEKKQLSVITDEIIKKVGWQAVKVSTSNKSVAGLCNKDRQGCMIDVVAKKVGTATITWQLKTDKRKKNNTKILKCQVTVVDPQPVQQPEEPVVITEATVATQKELVAAIMNSDIKKITIATTAAEQFTIANFDNRDLSQVELVVNAPQAEISNSALFKSVTINAIKGDTWTEHAKGNSFIISALRCHMIVGSMAEVKSISCETEGSVELEVHGSVTKIQVSRKANLNLTGSTKNLVPVVIGAGATNTALQASVPVDMTLEAFASLIFEKGAENSKVTNMSGMPLTVKTPSGVLTIGLGSKDMSISSNFGNTSWGGSSVWYPTVNGNGNDSSGSQGGDSTDSSSNNGKPNNPNNNNSGNQSGNGNDSSGSQGGNGNDNPGNDKPDEPKQVSVTIEAGEGGTATGTGTYEEGSEHPAYAEADPGYEFVNWNNGSTDNPYYFTAKEGLVLIANFRTIDQEQPNPPTPSEEENTFKLEIACGEGGYITIEGVQQNSFSVTSPSSLEVVTTEAHPNPGYHFGKWSDGDTSSTKTVPVVFGTSVGLSCSFEADQVIPPTPEMVTISVSAANEGGSVYGSTTVEKGTSVSFGAIPNDGYYVLWNDGSTETSRTITATENMSFEATFVKEEQPPVEDPVTVTFVANGKIVKEATVNKGSSSEIPNPDDCYVFGKKLVAWEADGKQFSVNDLSGLVAAISALTQNGDVTVTAVYEDEVQNTYYSATLKNVSIINASNKPNEEGKYLAATELVFKADNAPEGKKFSHLLITSLGSTTEYGEATYRRVLNNDISVEAVYVDADVEVVKPISLLLTPSRVTVNGKPAVRLFATLGFETGLHGEKQELGILRSCDSNAVLTLENVGVNGVEKRTTGNASDITFANSVYVEDLGPTLYAVAYLKYIDPEGNEQVKYTSVVTFPVEG